MNLEELIRIRSNLVQSIKENGSEGIYKLLTELYPDNAHFIYELLQNAEDTEATKVFFTLHEDFLEYFHCTGKVSSQVRRSWKCCSCKR